MAFANAMERYYSQTNTYLGAGLSGANTGTPGIFSASAPLGGGVATYELTLNNATATTFTLVATPVVLQVLDNCGVLTLTETGDDPDRPAPRRWLDDDDRGGAGRGGSNAARYRG